MSPGVHCGTEVTGVTDGSDVLDEDGVRVTVVVVAGNESTVVKIAAGWPSSTFLGGVFGQADSLQSPVRHISGELLEKVHNVVRQTLAQ
jgi:hypothetical protein